MGTSRITVVGAGVVGLTTAVRLAEAGYAVDVLARDLPQETTSVLAGALWYPYRAKPPGPVSQWARAALEVFVKEAADSKSGVRMVDGLELRQSRSNPWFSDVLTDSVAFSHYSELPDGYRDGWQMRLPVIEPAVYLSSLVKRLKELDGTLTRLPLTGMPGRGIVVNCSGLSARSLVPDKSVIPVQGQVVRVAPIEGVDTWLLDQSDEAELVYVIPRSNDIVVGGTAVENNFDRHVDHDVTEAIMRRAARLVPQLTRAEILSTAVGLRPTRPKVRLELEHGTNGAAVVHNYGHGGSGWTLSWGCADAVVEHLDRYIAARAHEIHDDKRAHRQLQGRTNDHLSVARRLRERGGQPAARRGLQA